MVLAFSSSGLGRHAKPGFRISLMFGIALVLSLAGCGTTRGVEVVSRAPGYVLAPDRGLMIVNIDSDIPLERVSLNRYELTGAIRKGKHFWVVELPAGKYSWESIETESNAGNAARFRFKGQWSKATRYISPDEEYDFEIVAGQVNYAGSLIVRSSRFYRSSRGAPSRRVRNHAAMAVRELREKYLELYENYRIRYAGSRGDTFLEHWESVRRRARSEADSTIPSSIGTGAPE